MDSDHFYYKKKSSSRQRNRSKQKAPEQTEKRLLEQLTHNYNIRIKALHHLSCMDRILCRIYVQGEIKRETVRETHLSTTLQHLRFAVKGHIRPQEHHISSKGSQLTLCPTRDNSFFKFFSSHFFNKLYDICEEQRHCCNRVSSVFATYDNVNNLHYKAHS